MVILCFIDNWKEGYLVFDPEKVVELVFDFFPQVIFDNTEYARFDIERFFELVRKKKLYPPKIIVDKKWEVAFRNGPVFKFQIDISEKYQISGIIRRFSVEFENTLDFEDHTEMQIIKCLRYLKYGDIRSNTRTVKFCKPSVVFQDYWELEEF